MGFIEATSRRGRGVSRRQESISQGRPAVPAGMTETRMELSRCWTRLTNKTIPAGWQSKPECSGRRARLGTGKTRLSPAMGGSRRIRRKGVRPVHRGGPRSTGQEYYGRVCKVDLAGSERDEREPDKSVYMLGNSRGPRALESGDDDPVDGQVWRWGGAGILGPEARWEAARGGENGVVALKPTKPEVCRRGRRRGQ